MEMKNLLLMECLLPIVTWRLRGNLPSDNGLICFTAYQ
jgi:hypothetical protein